MNVGTVSNFMVRGHDGGGWIYEARIIDQGRPLLTVMVQQLFSQVLEEA